MDNHKFIYFDNAPAYGVLNGAIQVELNASFLCAKNDGSIDVQLVDVASLRCSPMAARALISALQQEIDMASKAANKSAPEASVN